MSTLSDLQVNDREELIYLLTEAAELLVWTGRSAESEQLARQALELDPGHLLQRPALRRPPQVADLGVSVAHRPGRRRSQ